MDLSLRSAGCRARRNAAIVSEKPVPRVDPTLCCALVVPDVRMALAEAAARFYPRPARTPIVAVTGTSGKTSVAAFVRQIWSASRAPGGVPWHGWAGDADQGEGQRCELTTPDHHHPSPKRSTDLARAGVTHLALEASSHGLDQHRLDGVRLSAGRIHQSFPRPSSTTIPRSSTTSQPSYAALHRTACRQNAYGRRSTSIATPDGTVAAAARGARPRPDDGVQHRQHRNVLDACAKPEPDGFA